MGTALVTGANRGIGLELCRQLAERGERVIAVCRRPSPELQQLSVRLIEGVDVTDGQSVERMAAELGDTTLDLLINNAGILRRESLEEMDFDRIRRQFDVNALGPLRVTTALLPRLRSPGGKVALITSRMGSIADNTSGSRYGYRMSKAALNIAGVSLARDLAPRGVSVAILHPGYVRTEMTANTGNVQPDEAARGLLARVDEVTLETSGGFWHANGERLPW